MNIFKTAGIGLVLGITTVIPGVSVGTIAVVLNVYDRLIEIITPNIKKISAAWKFWLPLVIGAAAGILVFSRVITLLFENHPIPTSWFFIGVISGSIPLVYRRVQRPDSLFPNLPSAISCVIAVAIMALTAFLRPAEETYVYTELTPALFGTLFAGGILAATAMIIPGLSGSFLLLVIGLYRTIVQAVSYLNILLLIPVALGAGIGLLAGAALVRFLMAKVPRETYGAVLGLVAGSVIVLYPGGLGSGVTLIFSLVSAVTGFAISFIAGRKGD